MATKASLLSDYITNRFQPGVNTDLNKNKDYQAYQQQLDKKRQLLALQQQAQQADAAVAQQQKQGLLGDIKQFGPSAFKEAVPIVAKGIAQSPEIVAQGITRALPGGTADLQAQAQASAQDSAFRVELNNKIQNASGAEKQHLQLLQKNLDAAPSPTQALTDTVKQIESQTNKRKFLAATGDILLTIAAPSSVEALKGLGIAGRTAIGAGEGALAGTTQALEGDKPTIGGTLKSAAIGGAIGGISTGVSGAIENKLSKNTTNAVLDESRQIPAVASGGAPVISDNAHLLGAGEVNPNLAVRVQNTADSSLLKQLDNVESKITAAQQGKAITADEARSLMQDRNTLIKQIQTGGSPEVKQAAEAVQGVIGQHQNILRTEINGNATPRLAQRTEARAVADGLAGAKGFDNLPTYERINLDQQANAAVDLVKADPETAKAIAMGSTPPPDGLRAGAVYKAVEAQAAKQADSQTLRQLAEESTLPAKATAQGQEIAVLATKDPESPVDIMKQINNLRGKSVNPNLQSKFVTPGEAEQITNMTKDVATKKELALAAIDNPSTRLEYGRARVALDNYVESLKGPALKRTARQVIQQEGFGKAGSIALQTVGGTAKAMRATFDNSAIGRQGLKTLMTHPTIWAKNSLKSFSDLVRQFGNKPVLDELKADIISRPNSLNGNYKQLGVDVLNTTEEAFPQHLPEQIWGVRRFVKASDAAYTGFVQRSRADLADSYIKIAKKAGVDLTDKAQAAPIGKLVNALTGRGYLTKEHNILNNVFFSPRLLKSNVDVLTAHVFQHGVTPFVRKQAAKNLLKIIGSTAAIITIADKVKPGSAELDPRSANFGKIRVGNTRFDITGGMGAVATLAARLATNSTKSSVSGDITSLTSGKFGAQTGLDTVTDFFQNKLAPAPSVIANLLQGQDYNKNPTRNVGYVAKNLFVPLSITNYQELKNDPNSANKLVAAIADGLGISTNTYGKQQTDWRKSTSKELQQFKQSVPEQTLLEANDKYNQQYSAWLNSVEKNPRFNSLNAEDRATVRTNKQNEIRTKVLKDYGFTYKKPNNKNLKGF